MARVALLASLVPTAALGHGGEVHAPVAATAAACPDAWRPRGDACYRDAGPMSFSYCVAACATSDASLPRVDDRDTDAWLRRMFPQGRRRRSSSARRGRATAASTTRAAAV